MYMYTQCMYVAIDIVPDNLKYIQFVGTRVIPYSICQLVRLCVAQYGKAMCCMSNIVPIVNLINSCA